MLDMPDARRIGSDTSGNSMSGLLVSASNFLGIPTADDVQVVDPRRSGAPRKVLSGIQVFGPQTHRLPPGVMWGVTLLTATLMALINFCTIFVISFLVEWKFNTMQMVIDQRGVLAGACVLVSIAIALSTMCVGLIFIFAPGAGNSGAPENKGWLNGNSIPGLFTMRNMTVRAGATILANASGFPVGREGPTVTMGSNLAFLLTHSLAEPYVRQWVDIDALGTGLSAALMIDEDRLAHAKRIVCIVGGACGMAVLFDSPIGGIVYMFEEITAASWPLEMTTRAFAGTTVCALLSRALLNLCGTTTKAFVVYEWNPQPQPWMWSDVPFFVVLALALGPFSAFHTRACLAVGAIRQRVMGALSAIQPCAKIVEAIFYAALCATTYTCVSCMARCFDSPADSGVAFVRFHCKEGQYNPVASLLLTTSEGAVKRLFSRHNANELHLPNEIFAFVAYTTLNIGLTGVSVPSGNFTGSMLIGGLAGRIVGALVRSNASIFGLTRVTASGVYAMVGSAAMLAGFKQMSVAVVIFIMGCANDLDLIPPLMLSVTISLLLNRYINDKGFDEEQISRKGIPFLPAEPPLVMDGCTAEKLCDANIENVTLPPEASGHAVRKALSISDASDFPVVRDGICVGFTTRARLEAAVQAREQQRGTSREGLKVDDEFDGDQGLGTAMSEAIGRQSSISGTPLPVLRLAERAPYTALHDMPAPRVYALFAKAGAKVVSVVSERGDFKGMITRSGLIKTTRRMEEEGVEEVGENDEEELTRLCEDDL